MDVLTSKTLALCKYCMHLNTVLDHLKYFNRINCILENLVIRNSSLSSYTYTVRSSSYTFEIASFIYIHIKLFNRGIKLF